ncbi:PorP/SprF family type IX secretion system membrane protein [Ohtaekwangia sp.]|uniref:PorP/SprF family type IX secretion system membrane protein n=1 Tax=Ohtaekwangia sp. TaxID=2066019 RepID=UPI002FDEE7A2
MKSIGTVAFFPIRTIAVLYCLLISSDAAFAQQKEQFTQYMFNGLILNPAVAGYDEALSLTFLNRSQWSAVDGAPVTQTLSAHTRFADSHTGVGISIVNDKIGVHRNQSFQGNYAYRIQMTDQSYLSMGLQAGVNIYRSDYSGLITTSPAYDPRLANGSISSTAFTTGAGLYYKSRKIEVGLSAPEVIPHKISISDSVTVAWRKAQYFLFARYTIALDAMLDLQPSVLVKYMQGIPVSYDVNACLLIRKVLALGLSYRKQESIDFLFKAQVTPQLLLGYSYDYGTGPVSRNSRGAHELMLNYIFKYTKHNAVSPR